MRRISLYAEVFYERREVFFVQAERSRRLRTVPAALGEGLEDEFSSANLQGSAVGKIRRGSRGSRPGDSFTVGAIGTTLRASPFTTNFSRPFVELIKMAAALS